MKKINFKKILTEDFNSDRIRFRESKGAVIYSQHFFSFKINYKRYGAMGLVGHGTLYPYFLCEEEIL